jgi:hypothetical protein
VPYQWEDQLRKRLRAHPSMPKVQMKKPLLSMSPQEIDHSHVHPIRNCILTASREFLKNAEADEKKGNNVDSTKKDAGR